MNISDENKNKIVNAVVTEMKKNNVNYGQSDFEKDLKEHSRLFIDWRYFFEKSVTANLPFINALFDICIKIIA